MDPQYRMDANEAASEAAVREQGPMNRAVKLLVLFAGLDIMVRAYAPHHVAERYSALCAEAEIFIEEVGCQEMPF